MTDYIAEYRIGKAIVRMHGTPDVENVKAATLKFMQKVELRKRQQQKEGKNNEGH